MKVSREQMAENRERILAVAARRFREHGFDGISVADVMNEAGLTHGGFYGHFASKEELMAEASKHAIADTLKLWSSVQTEENGKPLATVTHNYLSTRHRDHPGHGCVMAALAVDASRQGPKVRQVLTEGLQQHVALLEQMVPGKTAAARHEKALATYAGMIGALVLSRAVNDPALSRELLQAVEAASSKAG